MKENFGKTFRKNRQIEKIEIFFFWNFVCNNSVMAFLMDFGRSKREKLVVHAQLVIKTESLKRRVAYIRILC